MEGLRSAGRALAIRHLAMAAFVMGEAVKSIGFVLGKGPITQANLVITATWFPVFLLFAGAPLFLYDRTAANESGPLLQLDRTPEVRTTARMFSVSSMLWLAAGAIYLLFQPIKYMAVRRLVSRWLPKASASRYTVVVSSTSDLLASLRACRTIDLAQPYYVGAPHHPAHPAYLYSLNKKHGDFVNPGGASSAADAIALGTHVGTHIDALCHFSCNGQLHGGIEAAGVQSYGGGIERHTIDRVEPLVRRGVLLDVAKAEGVEVLPKDFAIEPKHLEKCGVKVFEGDVALIRTGWAKYWNDAAKFIAEVRSPGLG